MLKKSFQRQVFIKMYWKSINWKNCSFTYCAKVPSKNFEDKLIPKPEEELVFEAVNGIYMINKMQKYHGLKPQMF